MLTQLPNITEMDAMHSQLQTLGERLSETERWKPYCEGLEGTDKGFTALVLENQLAHWSNMNEVTKVLQVGNFDKYAFPMIRAVYPNLIANDLVSVQPMAGPVSLVFYLDYIYGSTKGGVTSGATAFNSLSGPTGNEFYTSETVDNETPTRTSGGADADAFVGSLGYTPVRPGTVSGSYTETTSGTSRTFTDDGAGNLVGVGLGTCTVNYDTGALSIASSANDVDDSTLSITYQWASEGSESVPQLDLQLTSSPVIADVRKLKSRWSLEAAQNLNALHGLDAEAELVGVMAETVKLEVDREVINDIYNVAAAGATTWDKAVPPGISYTEHKLSLVDAFIENSNQIFSATKRGQPNWVVAGIKVCDVIEALPTFVPEPGALGTQQNTGVVKIGVLNNRWTIYKDPFFPTSKWMIGYKGNSFLEAGYVYSPYIPMYTTPTIILDDFLGRKGIATQYGKKVINGRYYATGQILNS